MRFEASRALPQPPERVYAWHAREGALERLSPPWERVEVERREGGLDGGRVELRVPVAPLVRARWVARHVRAQPPTLFVDEQERGPFRTFRHEHRFERADDGGTRMVDAIDYELPAGALGRALGGGIARRRLARMFAYRHELVARDLRRHEAYADRPRLRVAISGMRGLVGSSLAPFLTTGGHEARRLLRGKPAPGALDGTDAVVHLAGENLSAGRWSAARKERILRSRSEGTRLLAEAIASMREPPATLVSASAVGIYGDRGDETLDEGAAPGDGFLAEVCRAWEDATRPAEEVGVRVVHLRTGIVLSARGGALARLAPLFAAGVGGRIGDGRAWWSWIDLDDEVGAIHHALMERGLRGPVNAVAPNPVRSAELTRTLARVLRRPHLAPAPAFALRAAFGEMADAVLLASQRVEPTKLVKTGFAFAHETLESSLREQLGRMEARA